MSVLESPKEEQLANVQEAPYPHELQDIVDRAVYKPGWTFKLEVINRDDDRGEGSSRGLTLVIAPPPILDPYHPERGETYAISHYFPVPTITYDDRTWRRWVLDRLIKMETHEACEHFGLESDGDVWRPFAPQHGPGNNQYLIRESGDESDHRSRAHHREQERLLREAIGFYGLKFEPGSPERQFAADTLFKNYPAGAIEGTLYMMGAWRYANQPALEEK